MGNIYDTDENKGTGARRRELIASLAAVRRRRGLSQAQLAERIGTERSNISRIESGAHNPTLDMILRIADALDVKFFAEDDLPPLMVAEDTSDVVYDVSGARGKAGEPDGADRGKDSSGIQRHEPDKYEYELRIFDQTLMTFSMIDSMKMHDEYCFEIADTIEINDGRKHLLPLGLLPYPYSVGEWLTGRVIPMNRAYYDSILTSLGMRRRDLKGIVEISKALSLNDSYWVVPKGFQGKFADYNLYENKFSQVLSLVAYTGHWSKVERFSASPELTTNGMLPKGWRAIKDDGIYLYKGGTSGYANAGGEPYSEYYACQVAQRMGLDAIEYDLVKWKGILASRCKLFTDIETAYVPYARVALDNSFATLIEYYKELGGQFYNGLCSMLVFDAVVYNTDRHTNNFGLLRDNESGEIIAAAPIFDNGFSLFCHAMQSDFDDSAKFEQYKSERTPAIGDTFDGNVKLACGKIQRRQLRKLMGFTFTRHPRHNLPEWRLEFLENFIRERAKYLLTMVE
jgi:transcriptional regulator with XRE-family HTH domain